MTAASMTVAAERNRLSTAAAEKETYGVTSPAMQPHSPSAIKGSATGNFFTLKPSGRSDAAAMKENAARESPCSSEGSAA